MSADHPAKNSFIRPTGFVEIDFVVANAGSFPEKDFFVGSVGSVRAPSFFGVDGVGASSTVGLTARGSSSVREGSGSAES
jgi:hypothetical protein